MSRNLGATTLRKKSRSTNPMHIYDTLPEALRRWLASAVLPWSPVSCKRIWDRARKAGVSADDAITALISAEQKTLAKEKPYTSGD